MYHLVLLHAHIQRVRSEYAHSWLSFPEKSEEWFRGEPYSRQSLGIEKSSAKTSLDDLIL